MNITGAENLIFGVEDLDACRRFLSIYGLKESEANEKSAKFRALDGSGVDLRRMDDPTLPAAHVPGSTLRAAVWGVATRADLDAIGKELGKDREIRWVDDVLQTTDDDKNGIFFRVTQRVPYESALPRVNVAGHPALRYNERANFDHHGPERQLGHVVYWSPDPARSIAFYKDRLGFRITDRYAGDVGIFSRAAGHSDHHSLFLMKNPHIAPSFQHAEFTFGDVQEVIAGGHKLTRAGYETAFGPGRFELGSNWYWYFIAPMGGAFELGADIDQIDDKWKPGVFEFPRGAPGWAMGINWDMTRS